MGHEILTDGIFEESVQYTNKMVWAAKMVANNKQKLAIEAKQRALKDEQTLEHVIAQKQRHESSNRVAAAICKTIDKVRYVI